VEEKMFGIGMPELIIILVIALVVIGPKKLPDLAKSLGRGLSEFKKATSEIKEGLNLDEDIKGAREDLVDAVSGLDEPADSKETETVEEKPPKFEDFDEMLDDYHQEKVSSSKDVDEKDKPEAPVEKDLNV
jgi:TatA/E family protein of Tat protein translocase